MSRLVFDNPETGHTIAFGCDNTLGWWLDVLADEANDEVLESVYGKGHVVDILTDEGCDPNVIAVVAMDLDPGNYYRTHVTGDGWRVLVER